MTIQRIDDHAARTLALLLNQFSHAPRGGEGTGVGAEPLLIFDDEELLVDVGEGEETLLLYGSIAKSNWQRLLDAISASLQEVENEAWKLYTLRWISTAEGVQLDGIGDLFSVPRNGASDSEYRMQIQIAAFRVFSSGTRDQLIQILASLTDADPSGVEAIPVYPASVAMSTNGSVIPPGLASFMKAFVGAGIDVWVHVIDPESIPLEVVDAEDFDDSEISTFCDVDGSGNIVEYPGSGHFSDVLYETA